MSTQQRFLMVMISVVLVLGTSSLLGQRRDPPTTVAARPTLFVPAGELLPTQPPTAIPPTPYPTRTLPPYPLYTPTPGPTRTPPPYPLYTATVPAPWPSPTPRPILPTVTPQAPASQPTSTLPRPDRPKASLIQYSTILTTTIIPNSDGSYSHYAHYQIPLDERQQPSGPTQRLSLPVQLNDRVVEVWPSPTGTYWVLMREGYRGYIPYVWNPRSGALLQVLPNRSSDGGQFYGWFPDGRHFLFWELERAIWVVDAETLQMTQVRGDLEQTKGAALSPDGSTVAYMAPNANYPTHYLWLVNTTGADNRPLLDAGGEVNRQGPAWSPEGGRIVYSGLCDPFPTGTPLPKSEIAKLAGGGGGGAGWQTIPNGPLCVVDVRTGVKQPLALPYSEYAYVWSPDGRYLAATGISGRRPLNAPVCGIRINNNGSYDNPCWYEWRSIFIADMGTGQIEELTPGLAPVWSPDGAALAFLSNRSGAPEVWTFDLATRVARQLTHDGGAKNPRTGLQWLAASGR